jgi:hypothetical protein
MFTRTRAEHLEVMTDGGEEAMYFDNQYKAERGIDPREAEVLLMADFGYKINRAASRDLFIDLPGASGSNYSGATYTRGNYEYILSNFKLQNDAGEQVFVRYDGGHGTYGIMVNLSAADGEQLEDVAEYLEQYKRYPVLSDEHMYAVEEREIQKDLENWVLYDFKHDLEEKYPALKEVDPAPEELAPLWHAMFYAADGYWYNEHALNMIPEPGPDHLVRDVDAKKFVEFWALFPSGFDHHFSRSSFDQQQLMLSPWFALPGDSELDILLFGLKRN